MRNCPNCRTDLRVNAKFCVRCGFNVSDYEQNAERKDFFCPECGVSFSATYSAYYSKENEGKRAKVICPHCSFDLTDDALIAYFGDTDSPDTPIKVLIDTPPVTEIGNELPDTPPTDQPVRTPPKGVMLIGRYPYEADGEICALLWKVLTTTDEAALLIAERAIDSREYNEYFEDTTWEASGMRRWLNGEFIEKAFSPSEKDRIMSSRICTPDNGRSCGGGDTEDRIFLLSIDEAEKYFSLDLKTIFHSQSNS